ncbi:hypothetical protein PPL_02476 [Heterostelium album PN500]|uniref:SH3 domain-containing protein n=1 Tax=Heterostelium pallidum (strain ATCC 26659 / Pp 5 / PN500) TaxID=670386 RepID=D3B269_HETP5|nr:hypothetical protein PPL_02476 [Heterostelium album PN500]EFA84444.1 hypothetical protein PPL_02476 [Heterostelium album PN500]|eukprot:XP_020436558.1 hypothetical protein PPL_02476 [Heterostelium album PN500]
MEDSDNHYHDSNENEYHHDGGGGDEDEQHEYDDGFEEQEHVDNNYYDDQYYQEYDPNAFEPIWVRAIYDFDATNDTEISFKANDIVCITEDYNDGWWCGDLNGYVGRVPANYFEYLDQDQDQDHSGYGHRAAGGNQQSYDDQQQQQQYDDQHHQQYDQHDNQQQQQHYDTASAGGAQQHHGDDDDDDDNGQQEDDNLRKEKMRQKREAFKKEMKELQDKLKQQQLDKDELGAEINKLEKEKEAVENQIHGMKLLRYMDLEIYKTETDIELDSDVSMQARQTGIGITQDLRAIRTYLASLKSAQLELPKKQFDAKLEELEKRMAANLNNLDVCDNLKKSVQMDLALLQNELELLQINEQVSGLPLPPPPPAAASSSSASPPTYNASTLTPAAATAAGSLPPPPIQVIGGGPPAFLQTPTTVLLSEKDKRKSIKEAKKQEKEQLKEREREEKEKKKEKKKEEDQVWKPSKINK